MEEQKKRKTKAVIAAIIAVVLVGGFVGLISLVVFGLGFSGGVASSSQVFYYDQNFRELADFEVDRDATKIGLLRFSGQIVNQEVAANPLSNNEGYITPDVVRNRLNELVKNEPDLEVILLEINSPGGEVAPADEINNVIDGFAADYPVYVYSSQVLASGGYEMAVPAKKIYTSQEALTGSIGVIGQFLNIEGLANEYGVTVETFKAGEFKDTGNPFRSPTDAERASIQTMVDQTYNAFIADVAAGRGLEETQVRELATGDVWRGPQALELGLIDGVFYEQDLLGQIKKDESIEGDILVIEYTEPIPGLFDTLLGLSAEFKSNPVNEVAKDLLKTRSGLYYLYQGF